MNALKPPTKCEVRESPGKGYGVFATQFIRKGELIEECHLITLPIPDCMNDILHDYRFNYPQGTDVVVTEQVLPLGFGCIYNHDNNNNAVWTNNPDRKTFLYTAKRHIYPGEEICTYYGNVEFP